MTDESALDNNIKLIALYFPQLHAIEENDRWWGKGFTDWNNVKSAKPLFKGHKQPRTPNDHNYYDQADKNVIRHQVLLAKEYGIHGFCHYHYWFDGKQLLETPTNILLNNKDIDMPFCLSWANETWSRRWDGKDHHVLIKQTHPPHKENWLEHFNYLIKAWTDDRAITVDGKPVFVIYRPHLIDKISEMLDYWNNLAKKHGLKGLYFIFQKQYECPSLKSLENFDAVFHFQPFESINRPSNNRSANQRNRWRQRLEQLPKFAQNTIWSIWSDYVKGTTEYDYDTIWSDILARHNDNNLTTFSGAYVDWDNTARYGKRATIIRGANPERFQYWLTRLIDKVKKEPTEEQLIFINAWNEWSECAYLEPDTENGTEYLKAIKLAMQNIDSD